MMHKAGHPGYDDDSQYPDDEPGEDREECWACGGEGYYHDCGEDTCCCADPESDELVPCQECHGRGRL